MSQQQDTSIITKLYTAWSDSLFMAGYFYHLIRIEEVTQGDATVTRNVYNLHVIKCGMLRKPTDGVIKYEKKIPVRVSKEEFMEAVERYIEHSIQDLGQRGTKISTLMQETYRKAAGIYYNKVGEIPGIKVN